MAIGFLQFEGKAPGILLSLASIIMFSEYLNAHAQNHSYIHTEYLYIQSSLGIQQL